MSDFIKNPVVPLPEQNPAPQVPEEALVFTAEEKQLIERFRAQYPTAQGAVMKTLWLAQEKFGFLPAEVIQLTTKAGFWVEELTDDIIDQLGLGLTVDDFWAALLGSVVGKMAVPYMSSYATVKWAVHALVRSLQIGFLAGGSTMGQWLSAPMLLLGLWLVLTARAPKPG